MKKIISIIALVLLCAASAFAANGVSTSNQTVKLYSGATGTTGAVTTSTAQFDYVMNNLACDVTVTPVSAGTVTFNINGNQGSSATTFDVTPYLISTTTLTTLGVRTVGVSGKPFMFINSVFTAPTTTAVIGIICNGVQ